ncbi:MAG: hypothetical protein LBK82_16425 [Planctomycetaceae bacterium]|jgi:hypothetical protein|nr:hypothetical protein [Planctomycetaceae bacterium]
MNIRYKLIWDNPYWIFCQKGKIVSQEDNSELLQFEIQRSEDIILFSGKKIGKTLWKWEDRWKSGTWAEAHSGELVTCNDQFLARADACLPNYIRKNGSIHSTVLKIATTNNTNYFIEWDTMLWFNLISKKDIMILCDENKNMILKSVNPPTYNFSVVGSSSELMILITIFTAYILKIPMVCIGA